MTDQEFDGPLFKILSKNDSGEAASNQSGVVIPAPLRYFLPSLPPADADRPAPDAPIRAILILDDHEPVEVTSRYQLQTWKLTRPGETRITSNLSSIIGPSRKGDIFLIERGRAESDVFRLSVLRQGTPLFIKAMARAGNRTWGDLSGLQGPAGEADQDKADAEVCENTAGPFSPFDDDAPLQPTGKRIARSRAFRKAVIAAYGHKCAMCGGGARTPDGGSEIEAAHVIPRSMKGSDDIRNGIALCRLHHWAFDHHLAGITENGLVRVHPGMVGVAENAAIAGVDGAMIRSPANPGHCIHPAALTWSQKTFEARWADQA